VCVCVCVCVCVHTEVGEADEALMYGEIELIPFCEYMSMCVCECVCVCVCACVYTYRDLGG
jgi:hypothetical protein